MLIDSSGFRRIKKGKYKKKSYYTPKAPSQHRNDEEALRRV